MRKAFEELTDQSRIWIFQSKANFGEKSEQIIVETDQFLQKWAAHGAQLMASCTIEFDQFLIIAIDEDFNMASGCSIDSMTRFVQELAARHNLDLFDRSKLAFLKNDEVVLVDMKEVKGLVNQGFFNNQTQFFNNNIQTKAQLKSEWLVKPEESWLKRYFQAAKSVL